MRSVLGRTRCCCIPPIFAGKALPNKVSMGQHERTSFINYLQYISEIEIVIFGHS